MRTFKNMSVHCLGLTAVMLFGGCAGMTEQEKATAIGAGAGAVGGVIGHEIKKPEKNE